MFESGHALQQVVIFRITHELTKVILVIEHRASEKQSYIKRNVTSA